MNCGKCGKKLDELDAPAMLVMEAKIGKNSYAPRR
jgi:hypothetical protein